MSNRSPRAQALRSIQLEGRRRGAPHESEHQNEAPSPAIPITDEMIAEWLANDPEQRAWADERSRPRLW